ncbi:MAG: ATP/maltotriose-dependent transcriptional regulator MalT, partial [Kiritimatiellia bacterium]
MQTMAHSSPSSNDTHERARLTRYLDELIGEHRTVLLTPPPGSGKSVALEHWARQSARPVAWLHATQSMVHQPTFLDAIMSALTQLYPSLSARASCGRCRVQSLADSILELIGEPLHDDPTPVVLIMEELHLLDDDALVDGILALIRFAPPGLNLVLVYRGPLPLRLAHIRATLAEAHPNAFRLTRSELTSLINDRGVNLSQADCTNALQLTPWMSSANLLCMAASLGAYPTDLLRRGQLHGAEIDVWLMHQVVVRLPLSTRRLLELAVIHSTVDHAKATPAWFKADVQIITQLGLSRTSDDQHFSLHQHYRACLRRLDLGVDPRAHRAAA